MKKNIVRVTSSRTDRGNPKNSHKTAGITVSLMNSAAKSYNSEAFLHSMIDFYNPKVILRGSIGR
jgi:hypothetical protein